MKALVADAPHLLQRRNRVRLCTALAGMLNVETAAGGSFRRRLIVDTPAKQRAEQRAREAEAGERRAREKAEFERLRAKALQRAKVRAAEDACVCCGRACAAADVCAAVDVCACVHAHAHTLVALSQAKYQAVLERRADNAPVLVQLGYVHADMGEFEDAASRLQDASEIEGEHTDGR